MFLIAQHSSAKMRVNFKAENSSTDSRLFALLMGLDCYLNSNSRGYRNFSNLGGCVNDVSRVEDFLRSELLVPRERIFKLTATDVGKRNPHEPPARWPTYQNIVGAFRWLVKKAKPGDCVYIHYSGHGARVRTPAALQRFKGGDGFDEVLVPIDYCEKEDRLLRDFELAHLVWELTKRELLVTLVLDSCHAGGTLRGRPVSATANNTQIAVRSIGLIDRLFPPRKSLVASDQELGATWQRLAQTVRDRTQVDDPSWFLGTGSYVLLAASRASESAHEFTSTNGRKHGALSLALVHSLRHLGISLPVKVLYDRILAQVQSQFSNQTPQLQGKRNRAIFGGAHIPSDLSVVVLNVDLLRQRITINAGRSQGIRRGARFEVYSQTAFDLNLTQPLAVVEITEAQVTSSSAQIRELLNNVPLQSGDQAVLISLGSKNGPGRRRLIFTQRQVKNQTLRSALREIEQLIGPQENGFLRHTTSQTAADFCVLINADNEYVITGSKGAPLPHLRPAIRIGEPRASRRVIERLVHLTRYENLRRLTNAVPSSSVRDGVLIDLVKAEARFRELRRTPQRHVSLRENESAWLDIKNNYSDVLNFSVLELRPDWSIRQILPSDAARYESISQGCSTRLRLVFKLPLDYAKGIFVIKILATTSLSDYSWLELPPLDQPHAISATGSPTSRVNYLANTGAGWNNFREGRLTNTATPKWFSHSIEIKVAKRGTP